MYGEYPDEEYWANEWSNTTTDELVKEAQGRRQILRLLARYLPRQGKMLDAGCGLGQWVKLLRQNGYDIVGVDSSAKTIDRAREFDASLPVFLGDVLKLGYTDEVFDAYISLGVAEHFEDGPINLLREARRVLKPGGVMVISVPYFNPLRRLRFRNSLYPGMDIEFYQYAFTMREFREILRQQGFIPLASLPFGRFGIETEVSLAIKGRALLTRYRKYRVINGLRNMLKVAIESRPFMLIIGHMVMYVARKS